MIYLDVSVSIRGLRQKEMELILLPVLATVVMWCGKKSVVRDRHSFRMCTASLIHLVPLSDSRSRIVACDQLIVWLSRLAWSVKADLFCSDKLCRRWPLVNGFFVVASTSILCSLILLIVSTLDFAHLLLHIEVSSLCCIHWVWGILPKKVLRILSTDLDKLKQRLRTEWPSWIMSSLRQPCISGVVSRSRSVTHVLYTFHNIAMCCNQLDSNLANLEATVEVG